MSFTEHVKQLQRELHSAGYAPIREPVDISEIAKGDRIIECELIGRKDFFNVMYMEAESNWKGIASEVVKKSQYPCLLITRYGDTHRIFTTIRDHGIRNARPRHVVLDTRSKPTSKFIAEIRVRPDDNHIQIDRIVQESFDGFSEYKQALDEFADNLDDIIKKTRIMIDDAISDNKKYKAGAKRMLKMCREVVSDRMDMDDIKSMLIQHILTYRIFALVYDLNDFHATNVVAKSLEDLIKMLNLPRSGVSYKTMDLIAESLTETDQKQDFLKKIYETFYKKYDPAKADKDGIVYTPSEAVRFMVRSADELLQKHFGKRMSDDGVTILDPATGTGTFIVHIMRQIGHGDLEHKYEDLHANEISILPYYIAALNIEHTYREIMGKYKEFENICWIDTLDSGTKNYEKMDSWIQCDDNVQRISKQQKSHIQVTIGNPPYNSMQASLNNANPADKYDHLDKKIQQEYYRSSKVVNKHKSFDMYKRFLKWSSDRIRDNGIVVIISNNSFLDAKAEDGVRRALYNEFDHVYFVNLKGKSRDVSGSDAKNEGENIFNVRVGIVISFLVKTGNLHSEIQYAEIPNCMSKKSKLRWLDENTFSTLRPNKITPDRNAVWLNQTDNNFEDLVSILPRTHTESIFHMATPGITVAKDDWAYDFDQNNLKTKIKYYILTYNSLLRQYHKLNTKPKTLIDWVDKKIKWSQRTLDGLSRNQHITYSDSNIKPTLYRPFVVKHQYYANIITHRPSKFQDFFRNSQKNYMIGFPNPKTNVKFGVIGTDLMVDFGCLDGSQNIPLWLYENKLAQTNVTEYGLQLFRKHYQNPKISAEDIFHYVYAMFNDPKYEETYRHNLRREFPRIPLARNFTKWSKVGKDLFELHCNFNDVKEYDLVRIDKKATKNKVRLSIKTNKQNIKIIVDDATTLENVPLAVLDWTFESKTPLAWILEFYKESKNQLRINSCNDSKIRKRFNRYRFEDHKEEVITLLRRVTTVCVETVKLRRELEDLEWGPQPKLKFTPIPNKSRIKGTKPKPGGLKLAHQRRLFKGQGATQSTFIS